MPPPSRAIISSANRCATVRAMSSVAASLYCLPSTCGVVVLLVSKSHPDTARRPLLVESAPNATIEALAGAADHWLATNSCGAPGITCGAMLFDTKSKIPALPRRSEEHTSELQSL